MIVPSHGDLLASEAPVLVDPVNCVGVAGAGLALQFRMRFPGAHREYLSACGSGLLSPGRLAVAEEAGRVIVFFPTKRHWREPSRLEDIRAGLAALRYLVLDRVWSHVALPALGCGLGGLAWDEVQQLVVGALEDVPSVVELYGPHRAVRLL